MSKDRSHRILIVEDEAIIAEDIRLMVEREGFHVSGIATSGPEAIERVKEETPDLIFIDICLKGKQDGVDTAFKIKQMVDVPIVFVTAFSSKQYSDRVLSVQPSGFVMKPFTKELIFQSIQSALKLTN
jgi:CheY-like chemotaxis protein